LLQIKLIITFLFQLTFSSIGHDNETSPPANYPHRTIISPGNATFPPVSYSHRTIISPGNATFPPANYSHRTIISPDNATSSHMEHRMIQHY
jgi:hypothetical protein